MIGKISILQQCYVLRHCARGKHFARSILDLNIKAEFVQLLYHGSAKDYVSVTISELQNGLPLLIIGHNPSISTVIEKLCNTDDIELSRPLILGTANVALLEFSAMSFDQSSGISDQLSGRGHLVRILKP